MFGDFSPGIKQPGRWVAAGLGVTTKNVLSLVNPTPAITNIQFQFSPSLDFETQGFLTTSARSAPFRFRQYARTASSATVLAGIYKYQYSSDGGAYTDILDIATVSNSDTAYMKMSGKLWGSLSNSTSVITAAQGLLLENPSGTNINIGYKFGGSFKAGISVFSSGSTEFRAVAGASFNFSLGASIDAPSLMSQISSIGFYNNGGNFNVQKVTAGSNDTSPIATLNTYGSFAGKGLLVTGASHTFGSEMVVYGDGDAANLCSGTPTACSTYGSEGTCNAHTGVGCSWNAGTPCSTYNGTDSSTCQDGHTGCTWAETSCSGANNTDQTTCEDQNTAYGGGCTWDTSACPGQSDQSGCEAFSGCTWNSSNCNVFSNTDQSTCEGQAGCTWDSGATNCHDFDATDESTCTANSGCAWDSGSSMCYGTCSGSYDTSCSGIPCTGNYYNGTCSGGSWGALCSGTANCNNLTDDGEVLCEAEGGCTWSSGANYTLPISSLANKNNTSNFYYAKNVGATASISIVAGSGDTLESAISLTPGDSVLVHHHVITSSCSGFVTEGACTPSGCSWDSDLSVCNGNYTSSSKWWKLAAI